MNSFVIFLKRECKLISCDYIRLIKIVLSTIFILIIQLSYKQFAFYIKLNDYIVALILSHFISFNFVNLNYERNNGMLEQLYMINHSYMIILYAKLFINCLVTLLIGLIYVLPYKVTLLPYVISLPYLSAINLFSNGLNLSKKYLRFITAYISMKPPIFGIIHFNKQLEVNLITLILVPFILMLTNKVICNAIFQS
jgi:hypothetical protein